MGDQPCQVCRLIVSKLQRQRTKHAVDFGIAEEFGFYDASAFSRAFRNAFGASPSEVRAAGAQARRPRQLVPRPSLMDCLRAG